MNFLKKNDDVSIYLDRSELTGEAKSLSDDLISLAGDVRGLPVRIYGQDSGDLSLWALAAVAAFAAVLRASGGRIVFVGRSSSTDALMDLGFETVFDSIECAPR